MNPRDEPTGKDKVEAEEQKPEDAFHCSECGYTAYGPLAYVDVRAHIVNVHLRNGVQR